MRSAMLPADKTFIFLCQHGERHKHLSQKGEGHYRHIGRVLVGSVTSIETICSTFLWNSYRWSPIAAWWKLEQIWFSRTQVTIMNFADGRALIAESFAKAIPTRWGLPFLNGNQISCQDRGRDQLIYGETRAKAARCSFSIFASAANPSSFSPCLRLSPAGK